jgi:hypothetical protein
MYVRIGPCRSICLIEGDIPCITWQWEGLAARETLQYKSRIHYLSLIVCHLKIFTYSIVAVEKERFYLELCKGQMTVPLKLYWFLEVMARNKRKEEECGG